MGQQQKKQPREAKLSFEEMKMAIPKIERRISELEQFEVTQISGRSDPLAQALATKVNETLQDIFGYDSIEYGRYMVRTFDTLPNYIVSGFQRTRGPSLQQIHHSYGEGIQRYLVKLRALLDLLKERISDAPEANVSVVQPKSTQVDPLNRRVFVVHGHDNAAKESVARFLEKLDLAPVILHEQPNEGRTIIEKFEDHSDVAFAVILLTPDDIGHPAINPDKVSPRARQNVIFELGFFTAALGRKRICALYVKGVELPSDFLGVLYHELDPQGAWQVNLARELKASGLSIDMNRVL